MSAWGHQAGPARVLSIVEIAEQAPFIRSVLRGLGVPAVDIDDVIQDVMLGAWTSSQAGRYRPSSAREPLDALRRWLFGVCAYTCTHYHERAFRRREVPVDDPWAATGEERVDPWHVGERIDAAEALMTIAGMPIWAREVLVLAALGHGGTVSARPSPWARPLAALAAVDDAGRGRRRPTTRRGHRRSSKKARRGGIRLRRRPKLASFRSRRRRRRSEQHAAISPMRRAATRPAGRAASLPAACR